MELIRTRLGLTSVKVEAMIDVSFARESREQAAAAEIDAFYGGTQAPLPDGVVPAAGD